MRIESLKIKNFRSYKDEVEINFKDLTVFVGKNDIGKSTILEALDIFFNDGAGVVKIDRTDLNVQAVKNGDEETVISVIFSELPSQIVIDATAETTLSDEYMLNADGLLEIVKKYKLSSKTTSGKASVFIKAKHPTNIECENLLHKKNADLKAIIKKKDIDCENQTVNSIMRKAIWDYYSEDLNLQEIEIEMQKEDAKKIWDKLSTYLPVYSLFQSDRKNSDGDNEVQDPLKEAVKQIINDEALQASLDEIAEIVEAKLRDVSSRTLEKIKEMDPDIANSLKPVIPTRDKLKWVDVFKSVSISGDEDIPINKRGSGVKRLILLNFFRAEAERRAENGDNTGIIYAIEEPETAQHAENQRLLIRALKELAKASNTQIILTTHSSIIVKELDFEDLRLIYKENDEKKILNVEPAVLQYPSLNEVNYIAYNEVTEEYHNELFGFLDYQQWFNDYKKGKKERKYIHENKGKKEERSYILSQYIRHQIHHPENRNNEHFTQEELRQSINDMRAYIRGRVEKEGIRETDVDSE